MQKYLLRFTDGDEMTVEAKSLIEAVKRAGKKCAMVGTAQFKVEQGPYHDIIVRDSDCRCFKRADLNIPCQHDLEYAESISQITTIT